MIDLTELNMPEPGMEEEESYDASADEEQIDLSKVSDDMLKAEAEARGMVVEMPEEESDEDEMDEEDEMEDEEAIMPTNIMGSSY